MALKIRSWNRNHSGHGPAIFYFRYLSEGSREWGRNTSALVRDVELGIPSPLKEWASVLFTWVCYGAKLMSPCLLYLCLLLKLRRIYQNPNHPKQMDFMLPSFQYNFYNFLPFFFFCCCLGITVLLPSAGTYFLISVSCSARFLHRQNHWNAKVTRAGWAHCQRLQRGNVKVEIHFKRCGLMGVRCQRGRRAMHVGVYHLDAELGGHRWAAAVRSGNEWTLAGCHRR